MYSQPCGTCGPATLGAWWAAIPVVVEAYRKLSGGDAGGAQCWYANNPFTQDCPGTPNYDAIARAVQRSPQADIDTIIMYLLSANDGRGPKSRAELGRPQCIPFWTKALMGGKDCVASRYPEAPGWFMAWVQQYGAPETPAETTPGSSIPGTLKGPAGGAAIAAAALALVFLPKVFGKGS